MIYYIYLFNIFFKRVPHLWDTLCILYIYIYIYHIHVYKCFETIFEAVNKIRNMNNYFQKDTLRHETYHCKDFSGSKSFPTRRDDGLYCGYGPQKLREQNKVYETICPKECRKHQHWLWCWRIISEQIVYSKKIFSMDWMKSVKSETEIHYCVSHFCTYSLASMSNEIQYTLLVSELDN